MINTAVTATERGAVAQAFRRFFPMPPARSLTCSALCLPPPTDDPYAHAGILLELAVPRAWEPVVDLLEHDHVPVRRESRVEVPRDLADVRVDLPDDLAR